MNGQRDTSGPVKRLWVIVVTLGVLSGTSCTLLTSFDPEGQPCDPATSSKSPCMTDAGYVCINRVCTRDAGLRS